MSYLVKKILNISYAHRLLNYHGKCENLHGHNGRVEVIIESDYLDSENMVIDFVKLKEIIKNSIYENLDHKVLLHKDDPLSKILIKNNQHVFLFDKNPTAEIISQYIKDTLTNKGLKVKEVSFWETETSMASVKED